MQHSKAMTRAAYGADTDRDAENAIKRREKPFAGVDAFQSSKDFKHPSYMKRQGTSIPLAATTEPAPMPLLQAFKLIRKRLGRAFSTEENIQLRTDYPNGMNEDDITTWLKGDQASNPVLKAVG